MESKESFAQIPKVSDALRKGGLVSVILRSGQELTGLVCDRDESGLLLDTREPEDECPEYVFLPWSSVEQVRVQEIVHRRVKVI